MDYIKIFFFHKIYVWNCVISSLPASVCCIKIVNMKSIVFFTALGMVMFSAFRNEEKKMNTEYQSIDTLDNNKWELTVIHKDGVAVPVSSKKAFISFNSAEGRVGGNGSCNSFGGKLVMDGNKIGISNIFSTKMYCDDVQAVEDDFFTTLQKVTRYEIKQGKLQMLHGDSVVLEFEEQN